MKLQHNLKNAPSDPTLRLQYFEEMFKELKEMKTELDKEFVGFDIEDFLSSNDDRGTIYDTGWKRGERSLLKEIFGENEK